MSVMCCKSLVGEFVAAVQTKRFACARRTYSLLAKDVSSLPPLPATANTEAWRLTAQGVQLRVERAVLEEEQRELLTMSRLRSTCLVAY